MANEESNPHDIYDRLFKRILTLSKKAVIRFINGAFDKDFSDDSTIDYNWTEFEDDNLKKTLADTIITINRSESFHIEAQMYKDENIVIRMIDYGYKHAIRYWDFMELPLNDEKIVNMSFPNQLVIYLNNNNAPSEYKVNINFNDQGEMLYRIPVIQFQDKDIPEIRDKNLVILLPFKLLKLRDQINVSRSADNISRLRELYENDIISTMKASYNTGCLSREDLLILVFLTRKLFRHLYDKFEELKEIPMLHDESLDLEIDKYIDALDEQKELVKQKDAQLNEKDVQLNEKDVQLNEQKELIKKKDALIQKLQAELAMSKTSE